MTTNLEPTPPEGKAGVQSVTIWGAVAGLAGLLLPPMLIKLNLTTDDANTAATYIGQIIGLIGGLVAIWGRAKANTPIAPITSILPPKGS